MQSFIIISKDKKELEKKIENLLKEKQVGRFDITVIQKSSIETKKKKSNNESIGIEDIRLIHRNIFLAPISGNVKALVINTNDAITAEAQNSLLKLLEEPPLDTTIILTASGINLFLPTVISRCQIIKIHSEELQNPNEKKYAILFDALEKKGIGERLKIAQDLSVSRKAGLEALTAMATCYREKLAKNPGGNTEHLKLIQQAYADLLSTNANQRLILENLLILT